MDILAANDPAGLILSPAVITGAVGSLASVIGVLWGLTQRMVTRSNTKSDAMEHRLTGKLDECESKHIESTEMIISLTGRVHKMEGRHEVLDRLQSDLGAMPASLVSMQSDLGALHTEVLDAIKQKGTSTDDARG